MKEKNNKPQIWRFALMRFTSLWFLTPSFAQRHSCVSVLCNVDCHICGCVQGQMPPITKCIFGTLIRNFLWQTQIHLLDMTGFFGLRLAHVRNKKGASEHQQLLRGAHGCGCVCVADSSGREGNSVHLNHPTASRWAVATVSLLWNIR